jgi:hypothetical protein
VKHVEITKEGITRWFYKLRKTKCYKNKTLYISAGSALCPDDGIVFQSDL